MAYFQQQEGVSIPAASGWLGVVTRVWSFGLPRIRSWRARRRAEHRVKLLLADVSIQIDSTDSGTVRFSVRIVNFTKSKLALHHVELDHWTLGSWGLPEQTGILKAVGEVDPVEVGFGSFSVALHAAGVRAVDRAIHPAGSSKSSPSANLNAIGSFLFKRGSQDLRIRFEFNHQNPGLTIPDLSAG